MSATVAVVPPVIPPRPSLRVQCEDNEDISVGEGNLDQSLASTDDDINSQEPSDDRTVRKISKDTTSSGETTPTFDRSGKTKAINIPNSSASKSSPNANGRQSMSGKGTKAHLQELEAQPIENIVLRSAETPTARALRIEAEREQKAKREAEERRKSQLLLLNQATKNLKSATSPTGSAVASPRASIDAGIPDVADKSVEELHSVVAQDSFELQKSAVARFEQERAQQLALAAEKKKREEEERIADLTARQLKAKAEKEAERQRKKEEEEAAAAAVEAERLRKAEERRLFIVAEMERRRWEAMSDDEKEREQRAKEREAQRQEEIRLEKQRKAEEEERKRVEAEEAERQRQEAEEAERKRLEELEAEQRKLEELKQHEQRSEIELQQSGQDSAASKQTMVNVDSVTNVAPDAAKTEQPSLQTVNAQTQQGLPTQPQPQAQQQPPPAAAACCVIL